MSGPWYSSPSFFQNSTSAKIFSYSCRSFSFLIFGSSEESAAGADPPLARRSIDFVHQRHHVGVDDLQLGLGPELAAEQTRGLGVGVDGLRAAAEEPGDEHALERRDVELRLDRRLDGNLVEAQAAGRCQRDDGEASDRGGGFGGHRFP